MKLKTSNPNRHSAFTLIELLVVIAIITLMIALSAAGIFKILIKIDDVKTTREISDLSTGIVNFQQKYKVDYVPSRIRLLDSGAYDISLNPSTNQPNNQLDYDSITYLTRVWHNITFPIDWNNNGITTDDVTLEGDQCLVFFLGGIQATQGSTHACLGFSTNPRNPAAIGGDRIEPFFDFKPDRLTPNFHANLYFSYLDPYGKMPFAYFSSFKKANGYNRYGGTDCPTLGVIPFVSISSPVKFQNAETFQIISAGRDGIFGVVINPLGTWNSATADQDIDLHGRDDWANFYDRMLGVPTN